MGEERTFLSSGLDFIDQFCEYEQAEIKKRDMSQAMKIILEGSDEEKFKILEKITIPLIFIQVGRKAGTYLGKSLYKLMTGKDI